MAAKKKTVKEKIKEAEKKAKSSGVFEDGEDMSELLELDKPKKVAPAKKKRVAKRRGGVVRNNIKTSSDHKFSY